MLNICQQSLIARKEGSRRQGGAREDRRPKSTRFYRLVAISKDSLHGTCPVMKQAEMDKCVVAE